MKSSIVSISLKNPTDALPAKQAVLHKNISLLEVDDPYLLDSIFADRKAVEFLLARLSDRIALVDPDKVDALYARLRKMGYLPRQVKDLL
jgi:hypothetical protein